MVEFKPRVQLDPERRWWQRRYFVAWGASAYTRGFTERGTANMAKRWQRWRERWH